MLEVICGTKTVKRVLLYLFVNGSCYGAAIQKALSVPLTPVQKVLARLEKGGLLMSRFAGKTKLFEFNPAFPLMEELEALLKKAYTGLPLDEKKLYTFKRRDDNLSIGQVRENRRLLQEFWQKLTQVKELQFHGKMEFSHTKGLKRKGEAQVHVLQENAKTLIFREKGSLKDQTGKAHDFSNIFRWQLDLQALSISLEHLRRGENNPVFLFNLSPTSSSCLSSIDSHLYGEDTYFGQLFLDQTSLRLSFRAIGPKKNEEIDYFYAIK